MEPARPARAVGGGAAAGDQPAPAPARSPHTHVLGAPQRAEAVPVGQQREHPHVRGVLELRPGRHRRGRRAGSGRGGSPSGGAGASGAPPPSGGEDGRATGTRRCRGAGGRASGGGGRPWPPWLAGGGGVRGGLLPHTLSRHLCLCGGGRPHRHREFVRRRFRGLGAGSSGSLGPLSAAFREFRDFRAHPLRPAKPCPHEKRAVRPGRSARRRPAEGGGPAGGRGQKNAQAWCECPDCGIKRQARTSTSGELPQHGSRREPEGGGVRGHGRLAGGKRRRSTCSSGRQ